MVGALCLLLAGVFWLDYGSASKVDAVFSIAVLVVLALLGAAIIAHALVRRTADEASEEPTRWAVLGASLGVLLVWSVVLGLIGFSISSVAAFLAITWIIRRGKLSAKVVALDVTVAVVVVVGCALLFLNVFAVPLPVSAVIGI